MALPLLIILPHKKDSTMKFPFEQTKKDKEYKGKGKEGSKKEVAFDKTQSKKPIRKPMMK